MEGRNGELRVLVASDYPRVRDLLVEMAREEPGVVVVGQAENGARAVTLARSLRPDVALLDSNLPHTIGLDRVRLSRTGGLDAALAISEEVKPTKVIVLGNLDNVIFQEEGAALISEVTLRREVEAIPVPFTLRQLHKETPENDAVIFAEVARNRKKSLHRRLTEICEATIVYGSLGILAGLGLMITILLAVPGAALALASLAVVVLGLLGRFAISLWPKAASALPEYGQLEVSKQG